MLRKIRNFIFSLLVPPRLRFAALDLKLRLLGQGNRYYSQYGEDVVLLSIFEKQCEGFYVDVGAHHPTRYSNTYLLYKRGWRGINIDANPASIKLFKRDRPKDINILSGVAEKEGQMTYWMFSDPAVNSFSENDAHKWLGKTWIKLLKKEQVKVLPLKVILEKNLPPSAGIDLLNVDTEGLDLQVLRSNDWEKFKPKVIVVETKNSDPRSKSIISFLEEKNYRPYIQIGLSTIFIRRQNTF